MLITFQSVYLIDFGFSGWPANELSVLKNQACLLLSNYLPYTSVKINNWTTSPYGGKIYGNLHQQTHNN